MVFRRALRKVVGGYVGGIVTVYEWCYPPKPLPPPPPPLGLKVTIPNVGEIAYIGKNPWVIAFLAICFSLVMMTASSNSPYPWQFLAVGVIAVLVYMFSKEHGAKYGIIVLAVIVIAVLTYKIHSNQQTPVKPVTNSGSESHDDFDNTKMAAPPNQKVFPNSESESHDYFVEPKMAAPPKPEVVPNSEFESHDDFVKPKMAAPSNPEVVRNSEFESPEDFVEPKTTTSSLDLTSPYPWLVLTVLVIAFLAFAGFLFKVVSDESARTGSKMTIGNHFLVLVVCPALPLIFVYERYRVTKNWMSGIVLLAYLLIVYSALVVYVYSLYY